MIVNFDALCRDIAAMGPKPTQFEVERYAQSHRPFLESIAEIICFNYRGLSFSVRDIQDTVKLDYAGLSGMDLMLVSRCVKLMAEKAHSRFRHSEYLAARYYERQRVGRRVR